MDEYLRKLWDKLKEKVDKMVEEFDNLTVVLEQEYHKCDYDVGKEEGWDDGYEAALENAPLYEAIREVCQRCDRPHVVKEPGILCEVDGCKFYDAVKEVEKVCY